MTAFSSHASEARALRLLTALVAAATLAATVGTSFVTGRADTGLLPEAYRVALVVAVAVPLVVGALIPWAGVRLLRAFNSLTVVCFTVLVVVFAVTVGQGSAAPVPWFLTVTAPPVMAAVAAGGRRAAWLVLVVITFAVQSVRLAAGSDVLDSVANDSLTFLASAAIIVFAGGFVEAGRELDAAAASARAAAARRSAEEARVSAAEQMQALVHDELLSTLSLAARAPVSLRSALAAQAERAQSLLRKVRSSGVETTADSDAVAEGLASVVAAEAPEVRIMWGSTPSREPVVVPGEALDALLAAARQALANSVQHAGSGAQRIVTVRHGADGIVVAVRDDGAGFDVSSVPPNRMGISTSIVGRMRAVAGGGARVVSKPGGGTKVELVWSPPGPVGEQRLSTASIAIGGVEAMSRAGYAVALAVVLATNAVLAALSVIRTGDGLIAALAATGILLGFVAVGRPSAAPLPTRRVAVTLGLTGATAALAWAPAPRDDMRFGDLWFVAALAFVLLVMALRGRTGAALAGAALVTGIALCSALVQGNDPTDAVAATTRMLAIVGIGVGFTLGTDRVRARTREVQRRELALVRQETFRETARREVHDRSRELEGLIGDLLVRLAGTEALGDRMRRECVVLEGRLRDGYRAGRLSREPLIAAAADARERGVDVALFDDPGNRSFTDADLTRLVSWLAERLDEVAEGRFTGRVLPAGRDAAASAATDETVVELRLAPR